MTTLKTTVAIGDSCALTVTDITGFYNASTNPTGFLAETDSPISGSYKLSNGYFINILLYNKYGVPPVFINTTELFYKVPNSVDTTYANNFTPNVYQLVQDGSYTLERVFIISDVFYNSNKNSGLFAGKDIYYFDGTYIYHVVSGVATSINMRDFIIANKTNFTGSTVSTSFVSMCYMNECYYQLMLKMLPNIATCNNNDSVYNALKSQRDYIFITKEVIGYLLADENVTEAQKLIEYSNSCGSICQSLFSITSHNCGCNG